MMDSMASGVISNASTAGTSWPDDSWRQTAPKLVVTVWGR